MMRTRTIATTARYYPDRVSLRALLLVVVGAAWLVRGEDREHLNDDIRWEGGGGGGGGGESDR